MEEIWDVLLDALLDTVKILPVLLVVYYLIEFLEYKKVLKTRKSPLLNGKYSPVFGALFGSIPQCGFAVVSTDLFTKGDFSIGALIAVYIATSDEALPMLLAVPDKIPQLLLLIAVKIVWGIVAGYVAMLVHNKVFKAKVLAREKSLEPKEPQKQYIEVNGEKVDVTGMEVDMEYACDCEYCQNGGKFKWYGPLVKSLKISLYILVINIILGLVVYFIGEEKINEFLELSYGFQPVLAIIIGLIPNCASSVLITQLFIDGGISFGAVIAGLSVNAGMGIVVLLKQNKDIKENLFIFGALIVSALVIGYGLHYLPI